MLLRRKKTHNYQHKILHALHEHSLVSKIGYSHPDLVEMVLILFGLSTSSAYRIINEMILREFIDANEADGRSYIVAITERGRERMYFLCLKFEQEGCLGEDFLDGTVV